MQLIYSLPTYPSYRIAPVQYDFAAFFHIFGSVNAIKTTISLFDSVTISPNS